MNCVLCLYGNRAANLQPLMAPHLSFQSLAQSEASPIRTYRVFFLSFFLLLFFIPRLSYISISIFSRWINKTLREFMTKSFFFRKSYYNKNFSYLLCLTILKIYIYISCIMQAFTCKALDKTKIYSKFIFNTALINKSSFLNAMK